MKAFIAILALLLFVGTSTSLANPIRIAVIDTGINLSLINKISLCKSGHRDFTNTGIRDTHGHGTHVSGLIEQYANTNKDSYCQVILKYYSGSANDKSSRYNNQKNTNQALRWAITIGVNVINYSSGGFNYDIEEASLIKMALDNHIVVVVAAGNYGYELGIDKQYARYYPAMYDTRIIVVGNLDKSNHAHPTSNYGVIVNRWEVGTDVFSYCHKSISKSCCMTGTSQATAIASGKIIDYLLNNHSLSTINVRYRGGNYETKNKRFIFKNLSKEK